LSPSNPSDPSAGAPRRSAGSLTLDPLIGQVLLGRYEVLRRIGSGGMGAVYVGRQTAVQREVALKILRTDLMTNEHVRERFRREAEVIGKLHHPNTIQLIDYGETPEGLAVMVMELLVGQPLNDRLREKGPLPLASVLEVGIEVASSLAEAHLIGLVHRDLKPANIFLVEVAGQTHAKVLDFGIARILDEEATRLTSTGQVFGTPRYMSPEQALSTGEVDSRSDIYSLGLIIFECIVGQPPFVAQTSIQYLSAHSTQTPPKLREQFPEAPVELENLIDACLAKEASDRPQSADEVANGLRAIKRAVEGGGAMEPLHILSASAREASRSKSAADPGSVATVQGGGGDTRTKVDDRTLIKPQSAAATSSAKSRGMLFAAVGLFAVSGAIVAAVKFWPEPEVVLLPMDASIRVAAASDASRKSEETLAFGGEGKLDAAAPIEDTVEGIKDAGESIADAPLDAGQEETAVEPHPGKKGRGRGKSKAKDHLAQERGTSKDRGGPSLVTPQGNGVVTGPASMVLDTGDDSTAEIKKLAKTCKDSVWQGAAKLTLKGCPSNCAIIVDEKCAGRTPATNVALPPGYRNVAVVCGARIKMNTQAKLTADESADLRCQ
jgi:serine/threonine protein kinase